jgi:hypothetical protein
MSTDILNFINGISDEDFVSAKSAFDSMMSSKMQDALDSQRIEVASKFYNDVPPVAVGDEEVTSEEE